MKKILVALNIARGGGCDTCIKTAQQIAGAFDATLVFLHVFEPVPTFVIAQIPGGVYEKRKLYVEEELKKLAARYGVSDAVVREGAPATEIIEYASEINADLIVLHSHDPGLSDYFFGSVASRVVRHAHCSVHVVRLPEEHA